MGLRELIQQADDLLGEGLPRAEFLSNLELYVAGFDGFLSELEVQDEDPILLQELALKHDAVLKLAKKHQNSVLGELKSLKTRGKGLLAYINKLPSRVSMTRLKKG